MEWETSQHGENMGSVVEPQVPLAGGVDVVGKNVNSAAHECCVHDEATSYTSLTHCETDVNLL